MRRLTRAVTTLALVAGLLPTTLVSPASAHHDNPPDCASKRITGYIPVAQDSPVDATTLHYQVFIPKSDPDGDGKFAAVMDYSGYQPGLHIWDGLHRHFTCEGYAVIGLNIRGTGCSGGDFDYFEPRQAEDGREAIEWLAKQEWSNGRIAMVGKSYPGITQLFVAGQPHDDNGNGTIDAAEEDTTPDGLVAIVPGHVFGDLYRDVPYPGGIMNVTFAAGWSAGRIYEPFQAPIEDQFNRRTLDPQCTANTAQHVTNPPQNPFVKALYNHYDGDLFKQRSPWYWADNITMPTMLVESWQDEQVGSRATELIERFSPELEWTALFTNGDHGEYYGSDVLPHIDRFLRYHLAQEIPAGEQQTFEEPAPEPEPTTSPSPTPTSPSGKEKKPKKNEPTPSPTPTPTPTSTSRPETYQEALARFVAEDPVRLNWETGAGGGRVPAWSETYASWPPPNVEPWRLHFTTEGKLVEEAPTAAGTLGYRYQPGSSQQRGGYKLTSAAPTVQDWSPASWNERPAPGTFLQFATGALEADKLFAGPASVDLWLASTAPDTDLQVTLTEVRADGKEMFVQQGWLRASHREEDPTQSTTLRPYQTHAATDAQPLVPGQASKMRVEIFPFAHAFRAGSQLRLYIEAPHVKPDLWGFALLPLPAQNTIHMSSDKPSSIALPLLTGATAKTPYPPCTIRNQPCR